MKYKIFYDKTCRFCTRAMRILKKMDKQDKFLYLPLENKRATSFMLVWDQKQFTHGKALFGVFWLLGRWYRLIGWMHFLPCFFIDPFYYILIMIKKTFFKKCS